MSVVDESDACVNNGKLCVRVPGMTIFFLRAHDDLPYSAVTFASLLLYMPSSHAVADGKRGGLSFAFGRDWVYGSRAHGSRDAFLGKSFDRASIST